jgi:hypothetical protein
VRYFAILASFGFAALLPAFGPPQPPCTAKPCSTSIGLTYIMTGTPDTRPYNWGNSETQLRNVVFNPPAGYRVRVVGFRGTVAALPSGPVPAGTTAGFLFALSTASSHWSGYMSPGDDATFLFAEYATTGGPVNGTLNFDTDGLLDPDNVMVAKGSIFTNTTGQWWLLEVSGVVLYQFE